MDPSCPEYETHFSYSSSIDEEITRQSEIAKEQKMKLCYDNSLAALYRAASLSKHSHGSSDHRTLTLYEEIAAVWFRKGNYDQTEKTLRFVLQQRLYCTTSLQVDNLRTSKYRYSFETASQYS